MMTFFVTFACKCSFLVKSHHVMMTFLVFDLDVLFIPCYSFVLSFFLSFFLSAASIASIVLPYLKNYR